MRKFAFGYLVVAGLALRLIGAWFYAGNFDQQSYDIVVSILSHGGNVYVETARYNYSPVWMYLLLGLSFVATHLGIPFHFVVRTFLSLVDLVIAIVIARIAARAGFSPSSAFLAFWLNPVSILLTGLHGQFDNLAALPLLVATWLALRPGTASGRWPGWVLGTLSLLVKQIWAFSVWTLFLDRRPLAGAMARMGLSGLVFAAAFLPFLPRGLNAIEKDVFQYGGIGAIYGLGLLPRPIGELVFVGVMLLLPLIARRLLLLDRMELAAIAFIALASGAGQQYLVMPIIFGAPRGRVWYWLFTAAATPFLLLALLVTNPGGGVPGPVAWWPMWLASIGWAAVIVRRGILDGRQCSIYRVPKPGDSGSG